MEERLGVAIYLEDLNNETKFETEWGTCEAKEVGVCAKGDEDDSLAIASVPSLLLVAAVAALSLMI